MAAKSDYVTGTITLTNGSAAFTGTGTGWLLAGFAEGDEIKQVEGQTQWEAMVATITDNTHGTLVRPWGGATGTYAYRLRYQADGQRVTAQARNLIELLGDGTLLSLAGLTGPGVIELLAGGGAQVVDKADLISGVAVDRRVNTLSDRAAYDGQAAQFSVYVTNVGDGRAATYFKNSATVADWSAPAYVTGPAGAASTVPGIVWRGTYSGATAYVVNDGVKFNGSSFRNIVAGTGNTPSSAIPPVDNTWWVVVAAVGAGGADGNGLFNRVRAVATSNINLVGGLVDGVMIDGVVVATGDDVLLAGQTTGAQNGVYPVVAVGTATRKAAFSTFDSLPGVYFSVMEGTAKADTLWRCTSNKGGTLGTTALVVAEFITGAASSSPASNFRNKLINGDFLFAQRATSQTVSGYVSLDRWYFGVGTGATATWSQQAHTIGQAAVPGNPEFFLRCARTLAGSTESFAQQLIEGVETLQSGLATVTFWAKASVATSIQSYLTQYFGSGGSTAVDLARQTHALTSFWQKFTYVGALASITGKTVAGGNDALVLNFAYPTASANASVDISHVSVVEGDCTGEVDPFTPRHPGQELALCQRYYEFIVEGLIYQGPSTSASNYSAQCRWAVTKRVSPTVTLSNVGTSNFPTTNPSLSTNAQGTRGVKTASATSASSYWVHDVSASAEL